MIPSLRQRPLLLIGPPGIGKTAVMEQAARICQVGFVSYTMTHHTRQSALGLPYIEHRSFGGEEYAVTEYTMSEIIASVYRCMEETGVHNGLLFLDEINCVSETLAPAILQFLQNKTFGSHRLPDGWILAAAGNPPEYNKSVHEFDIATLDRLKYISVEADYSAWRSYAIGEAIHGAILAYLDTHPDQFYLLKQTYASRAFATARGWEDLSCMLKEYEELNYPVEAELIIQYLQDTELAGEFALFYRLYYSREQHLPVAQMLAGEKAAMSACQTLFREDSFEEQLYLVHLILSCINGKLNEWKKSCQQMTRFSDAVDRLVRFQKQNHQFQTTASVVHAFLEKERGILKVRRDHGLSPDSELEEMRQALLEVQKMGYHLRETEGKSCLCQAAVEVLQQKEAACEEAANDILKMLECAIRTMDSELIRPVFTGNSVDEQSSNHLEKIPNHTGKNAALVLFLSSLQQNPAAGIFFKRYPDNSCTPYWERLDFSAREKALKEFLTGLN
ncbi:MAG: MoxR family ATPase [Lachnospiraceae bacterium]|nr:MoxR family ATPase [Lachnospiraceae bacterium]